MKYINQEKIFSLLICAKQPDKQTIERIFSKARSLQRLSLEETAALLAIESPEYLSALFETAAFVKNAIYGRRIVLFAPMYISNFCANDCVYCAFKSGSCLIERRALSREEIISQAEWLLSRGHKRILMVSGESGCPGRQDIDFYIDSLKAVYSAKIGRNKIKRVNVNCAPLSTAEFKKLKSAGIGTYQLFQETYHEATYRDVHSSGPKSDPDNRIDALDRAFSAGIDDLGIGVLYGLYDWKFETLAMLTHIEHLEKKFNLGPHTISVPRIEPAAGADFSINPPYKISDRDFQKLIAILRISVPYTGIILSTRESADLRDQLFNLGISQISAESRTSPGGYSSGDNNQNSGIQFTLGDQRSLDQVVGCLISRGFIPSFCAACYRKERTGEAFMNLAKPGAIKGKCNINGLITLKEYLDDFASPEVKKQGYRLIDKFKSDLDKQSLVWLSRFFADIDKGIRDEYV